MCLRCLTFYKPPVCMCIYVWKKVRKRYMYFFFFFFFLAQASSMGSLQINIASFRLCVDITLKGLAGSIVASRARERGHPVRALWNGVGPFGGFCCDLVRFQGVGSKVGHGRGGHAAGRGECVRDLGSRLHLHRGVADAASLWKIRDSVGFRNHRVVLIARVERIWARGWGRVATITSLCGAGHAGKREPLGVVNSAATAAHRVKLEKVGAVASKRGQRREVGFVGGGWLWGRESTHQIFGETRNGRVWTCAK